MLGSRFLSNHYALTDASVVEQSFDLAALRLTTPGTKR